MLALPRSGSLAWRLVRCVAGLAVCALGIALTVRAGLGLGSWDVLHQGISRRSGIPIGTVVILVGVVVLVTWIPLHQRMGLGTVLNTVLLGAGIDLILPHLSTPDALGARWAMLVGGVCLFALGTSLYIAAGLGTGPRDGLMMGLAQRGLSVRTARTLIEVAAVAAGWVLGGDVGVGTIVFSLSIGPLVHLCFELVGHHPAPRGVVMPE